MTVLYGVHPVVEALKNTERRFTRVLATENALPRIAELIAPRGLVPEIVRPAEITRLLPPDAVHQGLYAEADPLPPADLATVELTGPIVVLDQVTDPHNVGAIIRTAAAFNVAALVTTRRFSPDATGVLAKAASGGLEHVPWARETNLSRALDALKARGVLTIGLDGSAETPLTPVPAGKPYALVMGSEGKGLREKTKATCDYLARIPLPGAIASLNVSNAAAIALTIADGLSGSPPA